MNQLIETTVKPLFATALAALAWFASKLETASSWLDFGVDVLAFVTAGLTAIWALNRLRIQKKNQKPKSN